MYGTFVFINILDPNRAVVLGSTSWKEYNGVSLTQLQQRAWGQMIMSPSGWNIIGKKVAATWFLLDPELGRRIVSSLVVCWENMGWKVHKVTSLTLQQLQAWDQIIMSLSGGMSLEKKVEFGYNWRKRSCDIIFWIQSCSEEFMLVSQLYYYATCRGTQGKVAP